MVTFDAIVIGGGITGAGVLRDLSLRGFKTLLLEKSKPGRATTASSTHLIHGGLRYLLYDRLTTHTTCWDSGHIVRIARPLLTRIPILWPVYRDHRHGLETVETLLESYDQFQVMKEGRPHLRLSAEEARRIVPGLAPVGLRGAVVFDEWWVDPVALTEANIASGVKAGGVVRTECETAALTRDGGRVTGVVVKNADGASETISAALVVNAAGPWVDRVAGLAGIDVPLRLQKGSHLLYAQVPAALGRCPRPVGLILEAVDRSRYVFVLPGQGVTLVGPTDIPTGAGPDALSTEAGEISYLLASCRRYFPDFPDRFDGTSVGARPILGQASSEKLLSREFEVYDHQTRDGVPGFITVGGGKMSDFRLMAEAAGDAAARRLGRWTPTRSHLEMLAGGSVADVPPFRLPAAALKSFLKIHPRLREAHAWAHLAAAFGRHAAGRLFHRRPAVTPEFFLQHYSDIP